MSLLNMTMTTVQSTSSASCSVCSRPLAAVSLIEIK